MVAVATRKPLNVAFGKRVRELREARGWTQAELAEHAGSSYQEISRFERGDRGPTLETLLKLADGLGVRLDDLRPPEEPEPGPDRPVGKRK